MPKLLSLTEIERFRNEGYLSPVRIMSEDEAASSHARREEFESRTAGPHRGDLRHKTHLLFPWLADLVRNAKILDAVEDLYGGELLCWTSALLNCAQLMPVAKKRSFTSLFELRM